MTRGYRTIRLDLAKTGDVPVYTSAKVADALQEITAKTTLYEGVKLLQILEAIYLQGKKDGARETFDKIDQRIIETKRQIPHLKPGRPKKKR